ncbi:TetR/AcrR family transcriptional regulator [Gordonia lacunae]|uniref:HTH tetR-type domain-containing protein n=1 Tax=Gordonia lacunae TaxID=417102 RepID=A0A243Q8S2_9ACTN|nr:TetR/AcrR family transcriptional regulator [Gordonia lacunae]OUC78094.1 hypothetical protein CA982_14100 [Gordonia lacunae]
MTATPPPPRRESSKRREMVENEIYETAARLFADNGYAGTNLGDIADAVGLNRGSLYYYVKRKDDLLAILVRAATGDATAAIREITSRTDLNAAEKLHAIARGSVTRQALHPHRLRMVLKSESDLPEELAEAHAQGRRAVLDELTSVLDEGMRAGLFRQGEPDVAALALIGMWNWISWWFDPDGNRSVESVAEQLADMAVAAVTRSETGLAINGSSTEAVVALIKNDLDLLLRTLDD